VWRRINRARTTAGREHRTASLPDGTVDERFDASGAWSPPPVPWAEQVDDRLAAGELALRVHEILPTLPDVQRQVVVLRDVEGVAAADVSLLLGITDGNQRVLLHRGRARIRQHLAMDLGKE
jgi:RNA polymerase sigma-70 factor, ECF subfamily